MRVFLVLPDLSMRKYATLQSLADKGILIDVLVSYTILSSKPSMLSRLQELRQTGSIGEVMLDSGAYHLARLGLNVDPLEYSNFAYKWLDLWDYVVAPDVPGDPDATLERTIEFAKYYREDFIPVIQGGSVDEYVKMGESLLDAIGYLNASLTGIGGLDGFKRRAPFISKLVSSISRSLGLYKLHLFGVGSRIVKSLAKRGLLKYIYSVDTTAWLAEIMYRRNTVYKALDVVDANISAIIGYLKRIYSAIGAYDGGIREELAEVNPYIYSERRYIMEDLEDAMLISDRGV
ncbi:MAG: hypothetical protein F7C81_05810 [Desulfurococcales archaeon]|nr:hypothetical protein [Desulfurococcales archaeon]